MKADIYFISDAHLGGDAPDIEEEKERRLFSFLRFIQGKAEILYIIGDLFDFWFEYWNSIPNQYFQVLKALSDVKESGTRIVFVPGNHDVWTGSYLEEEIGLEVHRSYCEAVPQGLSFFISHGDGMAKGEGLYRIQKWIMENQLCIWLYKLLHPDIGIPLARWVSKWSRNRSKNREPGWNSRIYKEAAIQQLEKGYDVVVLAHIHHPALEKIGEKVYLNTGDWITNFSYGRLINGQLILETWSGNTVEKKGNEKPDSSSNA